MKEGIAKLGSTVSDMRMQINMLKQTVDEKKKQRWKGSYCYGYMNSQEILSKQDRLVIKASCRISDLETILKELEKIV